VDAQVLQPLLVTVTIALALLILYLFIVGSRARWPE
jgi:hypothetical protein